MTISDREKFLIHVMNSGFKRAASAFGQLINRPVKIVNSQSILIRREEEISYLSEEVGDIRVLVTQIIGDITGKSYLIFNPDEASEIFRALHTSVNNESLQEAFLLEIDNIISASVIAELSNSLSLEIYGDVPRLSKMHSNEIQKFMTGDAHDDHHSSVIFCNTTFQFDEHGRVHPQFIWKLNNRIFDLITDEKITA